MNQIRLFLCLSLFAASNIINAVKYPELSSPIYRYPFVSEDYKIDASQYYLDLFQNSCAYSGNARHIVQTSKSGMFRKTSAFMSHLFNIHDSLFTSSGNSAFKYLYLKATKEDNYPMLSLLYLKIIHNLKILRKKHDFDISGVENALNRLKIFHNFNQSRFLDFRNGYNFILNQLEEFLTKVETKSRSMIKKISDELNFSNETEKAEQLLKLEIYNNIKLFRNLIKISLNVIKISQGNLDENEMEQAMIKSQVLSQQASERLLYYLVGYNASFYDDFKYYFCDNFIETVNSKDDFFTDINRFITSDKIPKQRKNAARPWEKKERIMQEVVEQAKPDTNFRGYLRSLDELYATNLDLINEENNLNERRKPKEENKSNDKDYEICIYPSRKGENVLIERRQKKTVSFNEENKWNDKDSEIGVDSGSSTSNIIHHNQHNSAFHSSQNMFNQSHNHAFSSIEPGIETSPNEFHNHAFSRIEPGVKTSPNESHHHAFSSIEPGVKTSPTEFIQQIQINPLLHGGSENIDYHIGLSIDPQFFGSKDAFYHSPNQFQPNDSNLFYQDQETYSYGKRNSLKCNPMGSIQNNLPGCHYNGAMPKVHEIFDPYLSYPEYDSGEEANIQKRGSRKRFKKQ